MISFLEQDKEPWMMKGEITRGLHPGKCRITRAGKTILKVFLPSDICWKILLKVPPKLKLLVLTLFFLKILFIIYLFINFGLHQVLVAARRIFVEACRIFPRGSRASV